MDVILGPEIMGDQKEAEIVSWLVEDGTEVQNGQAIAVFETGKATFEVSAPAGGKLRILAAKGQVIEVGATIARIG
jgi:pyruvate/2-oxoglutarate dehydrogenase complex dihydrolipoamide acyltransferase (E2) component